MTPLVPPDADPTAALARFAASAPADVAYAVVDSPIGPMLAARTARGLACLAYEDLHGGTDALLERLAAELSPRILHAPSKLDAVRRELDEYFAGTRTAFELELDFALMKPFARKILAATARIPFGTTSTYGDVAAEAGSPGAARAAGGALGSNPIPIVVPCHRVLARNGTLHGYTGGLHRKQRLLELEGVLTRSM
ncbi:MAG: methylated-DNA-[protein]-cysteine S-methyltransferase [Solirubrobacteraceae bacterium]|jgi:methylated-DNA-[protein]-cysteine S-methyltransferase|nr:methylated-DNA-[protein]-cysteine S-methyltransferase [Solirubrobacteraceae bacterium]